MRTVIKAICMLAACYAFCYWTGFTYLAGYHDGEKGTKKYYANLDKELEKFR